MIACQIHAKIMACAWMAMGRSRANVHQDGQVIFYFRFVLNGEVYFKHNAPIYVFSNICQFKFCHLQIGKTCTERISQCYNGQCANGGTCAPIIIGGEAASVCVCANGFGGAFCTETVDQCQGQPCFNGGTCESGNGWFRCACAQGFTGPDCRINVNECSPQPCLGGGTCIDGIGKYECICPKDRRGSRCEIRKYLMHFFLLFPLKIILFNPIH